MHSKYQQRCVQSEVGLIILEKNDYSCLATYFFKDYSMFDFLLSDSILTSHLSTALKKQAEI